MFVDTVSSEYDRDLFDDLGPAVGKLTNHKVRQLDANFTCRNVFDCSRNVKLNSLAQRQVQPLMASCSADFKCNPDGSWEISTRIEFADNQPNDEGTESCSENSSNQETIETDSQDQG